MSRVEQIRGSMREAGLDALLVTSEINARYLARYHFSDGLLLITHKKAYLITDFRYYEDAKKKADPSFEVVMPELRAPYLADILEHDGIKAVGYEDHAMPCFEFARYQKLFPQISFVGIGAMIERAREVKDREELSLIAKAQAIADSAYTELLGMMHPAMTEIDVALELEFRMRRAGAEGVSFETIAVSGDASALPHGKPRNVKLKQGFLTMDFGALYQGYCSDMTRTVCIGKADAELKRIYETVLHAQLAGLEVIRAGAVCAEVDKVARDIIDGAGYKGCFGHSLGHGVGMFIHESPRLSAKVSDKYLVPGNVVTVEPGIYIFGKYGCRIEDMVAVTDTGYHNFTASPKELIELF